MIRLALFAISFVLAANSLLCVIATTPYSLLTEFTGIQMGMMGYAASALLFTLISIAVIPTQGLDERSPSLRVFLFLSGWALIALQVLVGLYAAMFVAPLMVVAFFNGGDFAYLLAALAVAAFFIPAAVAKSLD